MKRRAKRDETALGANAFPRCALALTRRAARTLTQLYDSHLRESEMESAQFALLMTLELAQGKSQAELCQMMGMDKTTLSRNLKVLEAKRWVEPKVTKDARKRQMSLSAEGRRRMMLAKPAWKRAQDDLRGRMSTAEWDALWTAMQAVTRAAAEGDR